MPRTIQHDLNVVYCVRQFILASCSVAAVKSIKSNKSAKQHVRNRWSNQFVLNDRLFSVIYEIFNVKVQTCNLHSTKTVLNDNVQSILYSLKFDQSQHQIKICSLQMTNCLLDHLLTSIKFCLGVRADHQPQLIFCDSPNSHRLCCRSKFFEQASIDL